MKKKILIVDDSDFMRMILKRIFAPSYDVLECGDGDEAVKLFKGKRPDVTLLDIVMPRLEGIEALKQMKAADKEAKIIMITAVGQEAVVNECKELGAADYIVKPFDEAKVRETVMKHLE